LNEDQTFRSNADKTKYDLVLSINEKSRQSCVVESEVPPEEATGLFDKNYTVVVNGRIYDAWNSTSFAELPENTYNYFIPAADFTFETIDEVTKIFEELSYEEFSYDSETYLSVEGDITHSFQAGYETNPYKDEANDFIGFYFGVDAPSTAIPKGSIVYQYVTYKKTGDTTSQPISVGCSTKVGDPYVARVDTFNGTSSLASNSSVVLNKTSDA
jgi:hypothetical protein